MKHILAAILALLTAAATASVVGTITSSGGKIVLHGDKGNCVGPAHRAEYIPTQGETIAGCWILMPDGQGAQIAFLDGDAVQVPMSAIKRSDV